MKKIIFAILFTLFLVSLSFAAHKGDVLLGTFDGLLPVYTFTANGHTYGMFFEGFGANNTLFLSITSTDTTFPYPFPIPIQKSAVDGCWEKTLGTRQFYIYSAPMGCIMVYCTGCQ